MKFLSLDANGNIIEVELTSTFDENRILSGPRGTSGEDPDKFWDRAVLFDPSGNVLTGP